MWKLCDREEEDDSDDNDQLDREEKKMKHEEIEYAKIEPVSCVDVQALQGIAKYMSWNGEKGTRFFDMIKYVTPSLINQLKKCMKATQCRSGASKIDKEKLAVGYVLRHVRKNISRLDDRMTFIIFAKRYLINYVEMLMAFAIEHQPPEIRDFIESREEEGEKSVDNHDKGTENDNGDVSCLILSCITSTTTSSE